MLELSLIGRKESRPIDVVIPLPMDETFNDGIEIYLSEHMNYSFKEA